MQIKTTIRYLVILLITIILYKPTPSNATVEPNWPVGTPNTLRNTDDVRIDFEQGIEGAQIGSTNPAIEFTTTSGINWRYADFKTGQYNTAYKHNGNFIAWLGVTGDKGIITFRNSTATYVSVLVATYSGVELDAYDVNGKWLANSGRASNTLTSGTMTRLTVEAQGIAKVEIHDTGNYWCMDDLCTDARLVRPVPGRSIGKHDERVDLVFIPDIDYNGNITNFLRDVNLQINNRLGAVAPISQNLSKFNFYYTECSGSLTVNNGTADNCGEESSLPNNFIKDCPYADAIVVLHSQECTDCAGKLGSVGIFSAEGFLNQHNSFIHEAGHGVFGLKDEYDADREQGDCGYTNYRDGASPSNIWATQTECQNDARGQGWDQNQCYQFTPCQGDWWKLGDPSLANNDLRYNDTSRQFIMCFGDRFANGFGAASERRISWVFNNLPVAPTGALPPSKEKSIVLKLNFSNNGIVLLESGFMTAPAHEYFPGNYTYTIRITSNTGILLGTYGFDDPRFKYGELGYTGPIMRDSADFTLVLPYFNTGRRAVIENSATGQTLISTDLSPYSVNIPGDLDSDGDVDQDDVSIILNYRNKPASVCPMCDLDGDGKITVLDARKLTTMCTRSRCACS